jgi:two-component system response regulator HydG
MFNKEFKKNIKKAGKDVLKILQEYSWPGNVRELKNVIERAILLDAEEELLPAHIPAEISDSDLNDGERNGVEELAGIGPMSIREMEKILIMKTLGETGGNKSQAARILGISRQTLREKTKLYEME